MLLKSCYSLKQIVNIPTRGENKLEFVLTNLDAFYDLPTKARPLCALEPLIYRGQAPNVNNKC